MASTRDIRRCAVQALYQFDAGNREDGDVVLASLEGSPGDSQTHQKGYALAVETWKLREEADAAVSAIAPEWPTYRQPVVDRTILRLAYYEITAGRTPPKVAINEAVELAKEFSTAKSPMFINGVLDKIYKSRRAQEPATPSNGDH